MAARGRGSIDVAMQTVTAPDGASWKIKRHWISRRPRWRGREGAELLDLTELFSFLDDTPLGPILGVIVVIGVILLATGFLAFFVEVLIIVVALAVTLAAKFLFRRPWFVEAWSVSGPPRRWAVVGWRRSSQVVDEVARSIEAGVGFNSPDARPVAPARRALEEWEKKKRAIPEGGTSTRHSSENP